MSIDNYIRVPAGARNNTQGDTGSAQEEANKNGGRGSMANINSEQAQTAAELWHSKLMAANGRQPGGQPFLVQMLDYDALRADGAVLVSPPYNTGGLFIIVFSD